MIVVFVILALSHFGSLDFLHFVISAFCYFGHVEILLFGYLGEVDILQLGHFDIQ